MPYSAVPRVELNKDGTINLAVNVDGFEAGTSIEISGQATQMNGAVATFYSVQAAPAEGTPLEVTFVPVLGENEFAPGFPVTVVARAAEVWMTVLEPDTGSEALQSRVTGGSTNQLQAAWTGISVATSRPAQQPQSAQQSEPAQNS
jgi:hypothetical protein